MKQNILKSLLACLLTFAGMTVYAYDCVVDGIYYNLNAEDQTASVTYRDYLTGDYSGVVSIPDKVEYGGVVYAVTAIGDVTFANSNELTKVVLPNSIISIGNNAFSYCGGLTEITIPGSVTYIGDWAFSSCNSLTTLIIPSSVTSIGNFLFPGCVSLERIIVEEGNPCYDSRENCNAIIRTDGNEVTLLYGCKATRIPASVTAIGNNAFYDSGLTELVIPANVTSLGEAAFESCAALEKIVVEEGNPCFDSREDCNAIIRTDGDKAILVVGCKNTRIPASVTSIGDYAFSGCTGLTEFTVPGHITSIGKNAFAYCYGLAELTISDGVTSIGESAIKACNRLTKLAIPNSVTYIGETAFNTCRGLTEIVIGSGVTYIGDFAFNNCSALVTVFSLNTTPPQIFSSTYMSSTLSLATLHVPEGCKSLYGQAEGWKRFLNILDDIPSGIETAVVGQSKNSAIHTLDGVKLNTTNTSDLPSGIYVVDGKKMVVK